MNSMREDGKRFGVLRLHITCAEAIGGFFFPPAVNCHFATELVYLKSPSSTRCISLTIASIGLSPVPPRING